MNIDPRTVFLLFFGSAPRTFLLRMLFMGALVHFAAMPAMSAQTREECHKCCESQGHDEYYLDQCKIQCFRNPEHCTGARSGAGARSQPTPAARPPAPEQPVLQEQAPVPRQPAPAMRQQPREQAPPMQPLQREQPPAMQPMQREQPPAMQPMPREQPPAAQRPAPQRPPARAAFQWPNPLTLVPGRESDAAAQIIVLNGIPPQHPNFQVAAGAVAAVLVDFARNNPAGGALPTTQLERIIKQYR